MNNDKYLKYSLQDFLDDDAFIKWVSGKEQDPVAAQFWSEYPVLYPAAAANFEFAVTVIRSYRSQEFWDNKDSKARVLERITATIAIQDARPVRMRWLNNWMRAAAVALVISAGVYMIVNHYFRPQMEQIATGYGEMRTVTLPDHSTVTLNASSAISFNEEWSDKKAREVWIEGEAYFDVKHINRTGPGQQFIVHSNGISIEVLGTSFNVRSRHGRTKVGLITGKIKVDYNKDRSLVMLPGDYVEYANNQLSVTRKLDKPEKIKRWTEIQLTFTDATLGEIIETLQDNYGYTVKVADASLRKLMIEGDINVTNVEELLTVITTTLNVKIDQPSKKELVITSGK
ncbi:FecR family protein [Chitinophaga silvisoli]|uniref:DUF4974 domain-containing protein n=1 Tax=Chitinophaga silvisoli TaxID=2291814 RepID=A0A3E1P8V5_9BACT|nr:FecR domain-containing protein [Chitinophaga silvisoli]RFM36577.1 DUF4974 domain-containing protein [Chitinophaga silvisoli]